MAGEAVRAGQRAARRVDRLQQRFPWLGFPFAVAKKFGDDNAGNLAALVAYFAFFAVFPLLLVLVTVLGMVLHGHPDLQQRILDSALAQFPVVGGQLKTHSLGRSGLALLVGILGSLYGARGMAAAMQQAANTVWAVPNARRPGFPRALGRNLALILVVGVGLVGTTVLSGTVVGGLGGALGWVLGVAVSVVVNAGVFLASFRLATAASVPTRALRLGAVLAAFGWQVLQMAGGYYVSRQIARATPVYGTFAIVIGLLVYLQLAATITLYALEADSVRAGDLWPRSLVTPPLTPADRKVYEQYAKQEQRRPDQTVQTDFGEPTTADPDVPGVPADRGAERDEH